MIQQITEGHLGVQADIKLENEVGIITTVFNTMSTENALMYEKLEEINASLEKQVINRTEELRTSWNLLESVHNSAQDGLIGIANRGYFMERLSSEWQPAIDKNQKIAHSSSDISDFVTISMGISVIETGETSEMQSLIRIADEALLAAKKKAGIVLSYNSVPI